MELRDLHLFEDVRLVEANRQRLPKGVLMRLEGRVQKCGTKNGNGRTYPRDIWESVLQDSNFQERLRSGSMHSLLNHPQGGNVDPERTAGIVRSVRFADPSSTSDILGEVDVLDTPSGRIVGTIYEAGGRMGISSRGDGTTSRVGDEEVVQKGYFCNTWDFVTSPSTPGAYPSPVMEELQGGGNTTKILEAIEDLVNRSGEPAVCLESYALVQGLDVDAARKQRALDTIKQKLEGQQGGQTEPAPAPAPVEEQMDQKNDGVMEALTQMRSLLEQQSGAVDIQGMQTRLSEAEARVADLNARIAELSEAKDDAQANLSAAEKVIAEFQRQLDEAREKLEAQEPIDDSELQERYDACYKLAEAMHAKLQELSALGERLDATEQVAEALYGKLKETERDEYVETTLRDLRLSESSESALRVILEDVTDMDAIDAKIEAFTEALGRTRRAPREPLPESQNDRPPARQTINEDLTNARQGKKLAHKLIGIMGGK
jgi:hypothetical protein